MRLLFYGESPLNPTGFGNVNKHLLAACAREADVTCVASGFYEESYDRGEYPYEIIGCPIVPPEQRDIPHQRNLPNIEERVKSLDWDVFFYQGDMGWNNDVLQWVREIQEAHPEKNSIFYMPIDGDVSLGYAFNVFTWCSAPVVYTNHAKSVVAKYVPHIAENVSVIWLGCEPEVFYPLSIEEKKAARVKFFGEGYEDRFIALNVNRNQARKDLMRCMAAFHMFHVKHPDSTLLFHAVMLDAGGSLPFQAELVGCDLKSRPPEIAFTNLDLAHPWTREELNRLYNACDCLVSTSLGEGWGLTTTEAMAAGLPVVVPANTANLDIVGVAEERGYLVRTGGDVDHTLYQYHQGNSISSIIHAESFVEQLEQVYYGEAVWKVKKARAWTLENTWERRQGEWQQLLQLFAAQKPVLMSTMSS